jgi:hypothetical protein
MRIDIHIAACVVAGLIFPTAVAQDSSPGGPVHEGQPENCNGWHTVVDRDNCENVSQRYNISLEQFLEWNPAVSTDCRDNFWLESAYCVRVGERSPTPTITSSSISSSIVSSQTTISSVSKTTSTSYASTSSFNSTYSTLHPVTSWDVLPTSTDTTWPPTKTLAGETEICNSWHRIVPGDTCQRMLDRFSIDSMDDFLSWNPAAKDDCEMLIADYWVCIGIQRQAANTDIEWETAQPEFTEPPETTEYIPITLPTADSSFVPSPSHGPMPSDCKVFHQAEADQNCNDLVNMYGYFSQEQFFSWNPALDGNCLGLWLDTWYCVGAYANNDLPLPANQMNKPTEGNIPSGYPTDCTRWYQTTPGDSCDLIALMFGSFSVDEFASWNPSVFSDCSGIATQAWYCIGRPGTPTTRTEGAASPTQNVPSTRPTQSGIATTCTDFWFVGTDDSCDSIARKAGISLDDFYSWNRAITVGSCAGLVQDVYVCVGIDSQDGTTTDITTTPTTAPTRPVTTTASTTAGADPVQTPSPVREDMAKDCVRFYLQHPDEYCGAMASAAGISLT